MTTHVEFQGRKVHAALLLCELYSRTRPLGMGVFSAAGAPPMTLQYAEELISKRGGFYFDYLHGRPIKCHAQDGKLGERDRLLFDRNAGDGAFDAAMEAASR